MKYPIIPAFILCLALALAACGKAPSSSSDPYAVFDEPDSSSVSNSTADSAQPDSSSSADSDSSSLSDSSSSEPSLGAPCFVSLPVTQSDGSMNRKGLVVLRAPEDWTYDNSITFLRDDVKIAELPRLWKAAAGDAPFTEAMTEPYTDEAYYPEGFGLYASEDTVYGGHALRLLHLKIWMDDAEEPSYLHCAFYALDGYVLEATLYTAEEWGSADSDALLALLDSAELHFGDEEQTSSEEPTSDADSGESEDDSQES